MHVSMPQWGCLFWISGVCNINIVIVRMVGLLLKQLYKYDHSCNFKIFNHKYLQLNHVELSPNYAGTLFGITNMFANLTGFITPLVAGTITNYNVSSIISKTDCYFYY
jgi:hypothetical protein